MSSVTIVADVGVNGGEYRLLKEGDQHQTSGGIDCYSHIAVCDELEVDAVVDQLEMRYAESFEKVD